MDLAGPVGGAKLAEQAERIAAVAATRMCAVLTGWLPPWPGWQQALPSLSGTRKHADLGQLLQGAGPKCRGEIVPSAVSNAAGSAIPPPMQTATQAPRPDLLAAGSCKSPSSAKHRRCSRRPSLLSFRALQA
mmetsp:Transcript_99590/g.320791  ORF Transcript_99590/g.320791 Transcript_99590/m.320791 type:complete len:132 (-) Transcript_99590:27-422(-)